MAMRPGPIKIRCTQCSWRKTARPRSDVLTEANLPKSCPVCGGELKYQFDRGGPFRQFLASLREWF